MKKPDFDDMRLSVHVIMDCLSKYADCLELTKAEKEDVGRLIREYEELGLALKRYFNGIAVCGSNTKDDEIYKA